MEVLKDEGIRPGFLQIKMMCPFPADEVGRILKSARRVVIVEGNYSGQLRKLIAQETGVMIPQLIAKYTGRPVLCDELQGALEKLYRSEKVKKEVLVVGA